MHELMAKHQMWKWDREERGATAVEYGLMVAAIAAVIALAVITLGGTVNDSFNDTNDAITP